MRGSHGLPPSLLGPIGKRFRRQTVPHMLTPEACPTRIREALRLVDSTGSRPESSGSPKQRLSSSSRGRVMATLGCDSNCFVGP